MRQRFWIVIVGVAVGLLGRFLFPPHVSEAARAGATEAAQPVNADR